MLALWLTGCTFTVFFPPDLWAWESGRTGATGDTATTPAPTTPTEAGPPITAVTWGCDGDKTAWTWVVRVDQWTSSGTLDLVRTANGAREEHHLELVASDPTGAWDERRAGPLPDGVPPATQTEDVNTRFDCAATDLSFAIRVRGVDGALLDCVVGGSDPAGATAVVRELDPDLTTLGGCHAPPG